MLTAFGVFLAMRAGARVTWGRPTVRDRTVGVAGVGKVGRHLVKHLVEAQGGRVSARSGDDGVVFSFTVPCSPATTRS